MKNNKSEITQVQDLIKTKIQKHYPLMKILDMYFWQIGYEKDVKDKKQKEEKVIFKHTIKPVIS